MWEELTHESNQTSLKTLRSANTGSKVGHEWKKALNGSDSWVVKRHRGKGKHRGQRRTLRGSSFGSFHATTAVSFVQSI